ncbi:flagellar hook-associated protein 3 [Bacillus sp. M6-12]|uniref:flagellar hook-associated protein FlgL n=1 Tax=Bacillus sp. M6-12 TaxID=2054166 RepID=UPI000C77C9FB|nr:flagellar hook-associated protein FlgL [Bacillus sp. M6-12]PLS17870.1 flagellar hook-associated protein 3 [Bacillus sp. M6-12]
MRITQTMLTNSNLRYISQNYDRLGKLQDQIMSGKKISRPSDDPVVAMKGLRYRTQVTEVKQFKRNLNEGYNWMDNADSALDQSGQVLQRIRELTVQASNDSYDPTARGNIAKEISRLQEHLVALANTKVADNFIFNGTNTAASPINTNQFNIDYDTFVDNVATPQTGFNVADYVVSYRGETYKYNGTNFESAFGSTITLETSPGKFEHSYTDKLEYKDGEEVTVTEELNSNAIVISNKDAVSTNTEDVVIEVMKGVTIPISVRGQEAFSVDLFSGIESIKKMLTDPTSKGAEITKSLDFIDGYANSMVSMRAELGAQLNRVEMVENRLLQQEVVAEKTLSDNEDIDFEQALINLQIQESIHKASLSVGARLIQPTLMDFLR